MHAMRKDSTILTALIAAVVWFSIVLQFFLSTGSAANFFSYFTVQSNLLIAICMSFLAFAPSSTLGKFFSKLSVQTAIALYIFIVALVYNTVLRGLVPLAGWNLFADTLLHVINPGLYLLYWGLMRSKGNLEYKNGLYWVAFPLLYLIYSLVRGSIVGWYPYPFLNAETLGYAKVSGNVLIMIGVFFIAGLILIAITRSLKK